MNDIKYRLDSCITSVVYDKKEDAESQKQFIDKYSCCGACIQNHSIKEIEGNESND
jgi:hypothetical protein